MTDRGDRFVWRPGDVEWVCEAPPDEDDLCKRTSKEVLEDQPKRCSACRNVMTREDLRQHPCLCATCAAVIDRQTEEALERARYEEEL
jgi:acetyl-CoA carboxylase beta subunit